MTQSWPKMLATLIGLTVCLLAQGKIPPTLPVCPEEEELKVLECQRRLNASLVSRLPESRAFFTGVMQPTELSLVCKIITHYSACDTNALGFCRRVRPTPPPTDYFFMSLANFCYNGAFNDYPTLFLCYKSASQRTSSCYAKFQSAVNQPAAAAIRRDKRCRLYKSLVDCVSAEIKALCGGEAVSLVEPLLEISVTTSVYCTSSKFMKYVVSMQSDEYAGAADDDVPGGSADQLVGSGGERNSGCSVHQATASSTAVFAPFIVAFFRLVQLSATLFKC